MTFDRARTLNQARHVARLLWARLLAGVLVAIPLIATFWVFVFAYNFITGALAPLWSMIGVRMTPALALFATLALLIAVGFMATHVLGRRLIEGLETLLLRVPVIAPVYNAIKQTLESVRTLRGGSQFKRVVYVEYPERGAYLLGFATGQLADPQLGDARTLVFLPMAPNPLTGFVVALPADRISECSLSFEEASKLIVSAGLVVPARLSSVETPTSS